MEKKYCKKAAQELQKVSDKNFAECMEITQLLVGIKMGLAAAWIYQKPTKAQFKAYQKMIETL